MIMNTLVCEARSQDPGRCHGHSYFTLHLTVHRSSRPITRPPRTFETENEQFRGGMSVVRDILIIGEMGMGGLDG